MKNYKVYFGTQGAIAHVIIVAIEYVDDGAYLNFYSYHKDLIARFESKAVLAVIVDTNEAPSVSIQ